MHSTREGLPAPVTCLRRPWPLAPQPPVSGRPAFLGPRPHTRGTGTQVDALCRLLRTLCWEGRCRSGSGANGTCLSGRVAQGPRGRGGGEGQPAARPGPADPPEQHQGDTGPPDMLSGRGPPPFPTSAPGPVQPETKAAPCGARPTGGGQRGGERGAAWTQLAFMSFPDTQPGTLK